MKRAVIESPYRGSTDRERRDNEAYARAALRWALDNGYSPFCSHLLFPQVLDDAVLKERQQGIDAARAWIPQAEVSLIFIDKGLTPGMVEGMKIAKKAKIECLFVSTKSGVVGRAE